jgi:hypothetical protein
VTSWLKRKAIQKQSAKSTEKNDRKKWVAKYRRSRKYQRLTNAIELAQTYGYSGFYHSLGLGL